MRVASRVCRDGLAMRLKKIVTKASLTEEQKKSAAIQVLDGIVTELQSGFAGVAKRSPTLRRAMTRPPPLWFLILCGRGIGSSACSRSNLQTC